MSPILVLLSAVSTVVVLLWGVSPALVFLSAVSPGMNFIFLFKCVHSFNTWRGGKLGGGGGGTHQRRRDHVTPLLKELHWLPVKFRCQYKIATLAYRHFEGSLPPYRSASLCTYEPSRSLRSSNEKLLKIPKRNLKSFGQRSFSFMAPSLWNSLPATLRNVPTLSQFKSQLKTFLFAQVCL